MNFTSRFVTCATLLSVAIMGTAACGGSAKPSTLGPGAGPTGTASAVVDPTPGPTPPTPPTSTAAVITPIVLTPFVAATVTPRAKSGKKGKYGWGLGLCDYKGIYDTGRYTEAELKATEALMQASYVPILDGKTTRAALDQEYEAMRKTVTELKIVAEPTWEQYRAAKLNAAQQRYYLAISEIEYRTDPQRLKANPSYPQCKQFADLLLGGDQAAIDFWLAGEKPRGNVEYQKAVAASKTPDGANQARTSILNYGWHNCVNALVEDLPFDEQEFEKLFTGVKHECEEP
ncbi:MAG TPA: hypothetical protein PLF40_00450 [Kofleriaceae bacterium]|nr:hypothetical protein [Kofleriaceae bacterium]